MVVISAAVLSKQSALVARQFVEITKIRMDGLLSAFLKLVESGGKDHTYIETESVRYVYQPLENLFLLLVTNKSSNILEDLDTLRLLQQCVQNCCHLTPVLAEHILERAFDIVFAFDEVISFGYRESVTLSQIKAYTAMESHEEKLQDMIRKSKEQEEADRRRQIASKLDKEHSLRKREERERSRALVASEFDALTIPRSLAEPTISSGGATPSDMFTSPATTGAGAAMQGAPKRGMQLKKKPTDILESLSAFGGAAGNVKSLAAGSATQELEPAGGPHLSNPLIEPVSVVIEEKVTASLLSEGGVYEMDVQGQLKVTILDAARAALVNFRTICNDKRFRFNVHPSLNKASHAKGFLELNDTTKPFKADVSVPLVKWRPMSKNILSSDGAFPLTVNCWPSATSNGTQLVVELELLNTDLILTAIRLTFPIPHGSSPEIHSLEYGTTKLEGSFLCWDIEIMDEATPHATLEFLTRTDSSALFPVKVEAISDTPICNVQVAECFQQQTREPLQFTLSRSCILEGMIHA